MFLKNMNMDKTELFDLLDFYLMDDLVWKRTSKKGVIYFFVDNKSKYDGKTAVARYVSNSDTLWVYPFWFSSMRKLKTMPYVTVETSDGGVTKVKIDGRDILDVVADWFRYKFPNLDIRSYREWDDYFMVHELGRIFDDGYEKISSGINEQINRIKNLL